MNPETLANKLGSIAAKAIDERDQAEQQERAKFPELLEQRWREMRPLVFKAAAATKTSHIIMFVMSHLNIKVFNPTLNDFLANLPKELAEMHKSHQLFTKHDYPEFNSTFKVTLKFESNTKEYMAKLKRTREASDTTEDKKVKTEETKNVKTEEKKVN